MEEATTTSVDDATAVTKPVPLKVTDAALAQVLSILAAEDEPDVARRCGSPSPAPRGVEYAYDLSFEERVDRRPTTTSSTTRATSSS